MKGIIILPFVYLFSHESNV